MVTKTSNTVVRRSPVCTCSCIAFEQNTMSNTKCCIINCPNRASNSECKFYRFPRAPHKLQQRNKWIAAVRKVNPGRSEWTPKPSNLICGAHFIGNKKSEEELNPSYVPTIFPFICKTKSVDEKAVMSRFLEIHKEGQWLVMMYAPWCAHCKRLDPVWAHVAQHLYATSIRVGRVDCTRFSSVAHNFKIRGYPTILFLKGEQQFTYNGDRTKEEIVKFALRLNGPPVQEITKTQSFDTLKKDRGLYFLYVGERIGSLWDLYHQTAETFQPHAFFYQSHPTVVDKHAPIETIPAVFVYKESSHYNFSGHDHSDSVKLNETIYKWINAERFSTFPKVTRGNINQLFLTNKNLVLAVVEENAVEDVSPDMLEFRDMVESVIQQKREKYHEHFQFGWTANSEWINSIAMRVMPLPSLIVINTSTSHHHIPDDEPRKLTPQVIEMFLDNIHNEMAQKYGGNGWLVQVYRSWFDLRMTLSSMWKGNPVVTMVVFGLPALFLSLICYGICCPDILDAGDEEDAEDEGGNHMKKD